MPSVTYDGRSFMLDGRRIWLVGATVPMAQIPRDRWAERLHQAKQSGFNTIDTSVVWSRHEPRPGKFDFTGENDLRHFVKLVQEAGLWCVLRVGPYIGGRLDQGGLPAWLAEVKNVALRTKNTPFLDACSRYVNAVSEQVRDLQVSSPGRGGPVLLVQNESRWTCGDDGIAHDYLGELARYLRESGFVVPIINSNSLWQSAEGEVDGWVGSDDMLATMRQLASVHADQPRLVVDFELGVASRFGVEPGAQPEPWLVQRRLAEALAGGGQFIVSPFASGVVTGFGGGRLADDPRAYATPMSDTAALVSSTGVPSAALPMVRRLATFASRFGRVFSAMDPAFQPITLHPGSGGTERSPRAGKGASSAPVSAGHVIVHAAGSQGAVVFVFADEPPGEGGSPATLLLPDGSTLRVALGSQAVSWCLFDTNVTPRAHLDYTNLNALAVVGRVLVCFGPAGSAGVLCVNGSPVELKVPAPGDSVRPVEHEGLHILVLSEEHADTTHCTESAVYVGVEGVTADGRPIVRPGVKSFTSVSSEGVGQTVNASSPKSLAVFAAGTPAAAKAVCGEWTAVSTEDYASGESARFASIPGPTDLSLLGAPYGYGWYRIVLKPPASRKVHVRCPHGGDRLHFFTEGKPLGVVGGGPGAGGEVSLPLHKGQQNVVVLADNLGRYAEGPHMGEAKGLCGHLWEAHEIKAGPAKPVLGEPVDVLSFRTPLWEVRSGDATEPQRMTWTLPAGRKTPVLMEFAAEGAGDARGLVMVGGKPVTFFDRGGPDRVFIEPEQLGKHAQVQLALLADPSGREPVEKSLRAAADRVRFYACEANLSAKADWFFAKWEPPTASSYKPAAKVGRTTGVPTWWRCTFKPGKSAAPLVLDLTGLTKGQVYVNGRNLSRYFVATASGKTVPPQTRVVIPDSWLKPSGAENELVIFDEHGASPTKTKLHHYPALAAPGVMPASH